MGHVRQVFVWLETQPRHVIASFTLLLFALVAISDFLTRPGVTTSIYYIAPIALSSWFLGKRSGAAVAAGGAMTWMAKDVYLRNYSLADAWILAWNGFARFALFLLIAFLIAEFRVHLQREQRLAQRDHLTDCLNRRAFTERADYELMRHRRSRLPLSLMYIDLDNFKPVNDQFGHAAGDRALKVVAEVAQRCLRRTDHVGRLGGDEFAVLLTDTEPNSAREAADKLVSELQAAMRTNGWPIDFSIGLVSVVESSDEDSEALLQAADEAMYSVKGRGKGGLAHRVLGDFARDREGS